MSRAAIIGTGLIGASIGIGLRGLGFEVVGWDPDPSALEGAMACGALDAAPPTEQGAVGGADLVVLAAPPQAIIDLLGSLSTEALVTDVSGVKQIVVERAAHLPHFVGGHPMAGRESSGPAHASGSLFRGAIWALTTDHADPADVEELSDLVTALGAIPRRMTAADHDAAVAAVSHLPQVVASVLVNRVAAEPHGFDLAAGGFRDLTRIAASDPGWWVEVLVENQTSLSPLLRRMGDDLKVWADRIDAGDRLDLHGRMTQAMDTRRSLTPPVAAIGVLLDDRPGEIARVGHALAESGVDLRDLQLRHATHGGGGVLTLSVRVAESDRLRAALAREGFRLLE
jgi:prephenate dehydrogenase